MLLSAYRDLSQVRGTFAIDMKARIRESLERLVALYEAIPRPADAAEWKLKLAEFDQLQTSRQPKPATETFQASAASARRSP